MGRVAILVVLSLLLVACGTNDPDATVELFGPETFGSWQLTSGENGSEEIPLLGSHPVTITIESGQIGGTAACNSYGASVEDGGVGPISVTEMACSPARAMEIERMFLQALAKIEKTTLEDGMVLVATSGEAANGGPSTELRFEPLPVVPTAELTGTVWVLDGLISGDAISSVSGERATLELFTDGSFIGSTGCRDLAGTYQVSGSEVLFTSFSANGSCPADLQAQDSHVISALEGGFRVEIDGNRMTTWVAGDEGLSYLAS